MMITTLQKHKREITDLKIKLSNEKTKLEIRQIEFAEREKHYKLQRKTDEKVILMLQKELKRCTESELALKEENIQLKQELEKTKDMADKLRAMFKKNSTTSSKPPSSDIFVKAKAKSSKKKSGKKPGGQPGHTGYHCKPFPDPTTIVEKRPPKTCDCGGTVICNDEYVGKQKADIKIVVDVTEERVFTGFCEACGKTHKGQFSEGYINPIQYGNVIKTIVLMLNTYANVSMNKITEFVSSITGSMINLSNATVVNINYELSKKLETVIEVIKNQLINSGLLLVDETGVRVSGKINWMQIFTNDMFTLFSANTKRGDVTFEGFDLLAVFTGILMHDHFVSYYKYQHLTHAECNVHILRYIKAIIEIQRHPWAQELHDFFCKSNKEKNELIADGIYSFTADKIESLKDEYSKILDAGDIQYASAIEGKSSIKYFVEERRLLTRLREYADQHLLFLLKFEVPFSNNESERGARTAKSKIKVSAGFRSIEGASAYARIISIIATARKQKLSIFDTIKAIFDGKTISFPAIELADTG